ncbi:thioredoxin [Methylobacillus rhizosphaerae]|uniref:Thioredoxin n=1 Tax=Methylobacillus rhizosphaerae TaxID=551994 RepID=A0A238YS97_9PROT|nr:thioredoxin family protein [Methylobacillus rhizosphaerae]SNR74017.1 thioredoxin [Methylobacillus rhizosphaerae]
MAVQHLNKGNFKQAIEGNAFVIVDFWAPWCEPCMSFSPTFEAASDVHSEIVFAMVNIDESPEIAQYFNVKQIPAVMPIRNQVVVDAQVGDMTARELDEAIAAWGEFDVTEIDRYFKEKQAV